MDPRFAQAHPATQGITQLYFQYAGQLAPKVQANPELEFESLVNSGIAGRVLTIDLASPQTLDQRRGGQNAVFTIAAHIKGKNAEAALPDQTSDVKQEKANTNVIYVADVDTLNDFYLAVRAEPIQNGVEYSYQNVSFVLNLVDALTDTTDYAALRTRKINHVTLEVVERTYQQAMENVYKLDQDLSIEFQNSLNDAQAESRRALEPIQKSVERLTQKKDAGEPYDAAKLFAQSSLLTQQASEQRQRLEKRRTELQNQRREKKREIELQAELEIQEIQRQYKIAAVVLPPIPPLLVGIFVATRRRLREREGISKARRLK